VSRRWRDRLHARLDADGASLRLVRRGLRTRTTVAEARSTCDPPAADASSAIDALDCALRELAGREPGLAGMPCDIVLADAWMLYDVIESDLDDVPRRAADALVRAALADTAGAAPDDLLVRWQRHGDRGFACALPVSTMQALQGVLQRHEVRPGRVTGEFVLAYEARRHAFRAGRAVLAVPRAAGAQLGLVADGRLVATRFEPVVGDAAALTAASRALMHCCGAEPDERTGYFTDVDACGIDRTRWVRDTPPADWPTRLRTRLAQPSLDLSPTRPRVHALSWALLALGALATLVAGVQFQTANGQHLREARALRALEASLDATRQGRRGHARAADGDDGRAGAAVVRELQVPWARLFAALEGVARDDVALLSIEPSAAKQEVRIVAEAKSSDAMLDFLDALRTQPLRRVVLVSHQVQIQTPGSPVRFQARATWETR
jgi:hypothetical protein